MTTRTRLAAPFSTYLAVTRIAVRRRARERLVLLARVVQYTLILFIFSRLWKVLLQGDHGGPGPVESVWYLAVTEWIIIPLPRVHLEIERDVRSGDVAHSLNRPLSYLGYKFAESLGELLLSMAVLAVPGALVAYAFSGGLPDDPARLWLVAPVALLAAVCALLFQLAIGLTSFWLHDCSPIYWVWQKATFVLGGLMVPLVLYPDWLRRLTAWTPFAAMLSGPGSMVLSASPLRALQVAGTLLLWIGAASALVRWLYLRALRVLVLNGG